MKSRHDPKLEGLVNREKSNYLFTALNNYTMLCFFPDYRFVSQISSSQLPLEIQKSPVTPPSTSTSNGQEIQSISLTGESQMQLPFSISIVNTPACKMAALAPNCSQEYCLASLQTLLIKPKQNDYLAKIIQWLLIVLRIA